MSCSSECSKKPKSELLKRVDSPDWASLRKKYSTMMPSSIKLASTFAMMPKLQGYQLEVYEHDDEKCSALVLREPNDSVGTVTNTVFCSPDDAARDRVMEFLDSDLDWDADQVFGDIQDHLTEPVKALCAKKGKLAWETYAEMFVLESESDLTDASSSSSLPDDGVEVRALGTEHAATVVDNWEFALASTKDRMAAMFEQGLCYGTFDKGELVSWICTMRYGGMGILFTPEAHRRKGHAQRCLVGLARRLLSLGLTPYVYIEDYNEASKKLFSRTGFKRQHRANWFGFSPDASASSSCSKKGCCY